MSDLVRTISGLILFDDFATNTLSNYTEFADIAASPGWSYDSVNQRLQVDVTTAGAQSTFLRNALTQQNLVIECLVIPSKDGGIIYRQTDNINYWLLALREDIVATNLELFTRVAGIFTSVGSFDTTWVSGTSKVIKLVTSGTSHSVYENGTLRISITNATQNVSGKFGFRISQFASSFVALYDDFKVYTNETVVVNNVSNNNFVELIDSLDVVVTSGVVSGTSITLGFSSSSSRPKYKNVKVWQDSGKTVLLHEIHVSNSSFNNVWGGDTYQPAIATNQVLSQNTTIKTTNTLILNQNVILKDIFSKSLNQEAIVKISSQRILLQNAFIKQPLHFGYNIKVKS